AEGARAEVEDGEEQRQAGESALAAREQRDGLEALAARLRHELDPGVERVAARLGLDQPQLGTASLEEPLEESAEVTVDLFERLDEAVLRRARHAAQRLVQVLDRRREIVVLSAQEREPLVELAILVVGDQVDRADRGQSLVELGHAGARRIEIARGVVRGKQRRRIDAVHSPRL